MTRVAHIDADVLKYNAGFAVQKEIWTHEPTGEWFEGKDAANEWLVDTYNGPQKNEKGVRTGIRAWMKENWKDGDWTSEIQLEPFNNCIFIIDNKIGEILYANECEEAILCLTPSRVFRHDIATVKGYKESRIGKPKPEYYEKIHEYMLASYDCRIGDNIEADDIMGQLQTTETVIASNDKDLKMIPGEHYDFTTGEKQMVDIFEADRQFFVQLISGDSVDDIPGIPGLGTAKAEKIVDMFDGDHWELVQHITDLYSDHYGHGSHKLGLDVKAMAIRDEMAALVWILRKGETPETAGWREMLYETEVRDN